MTISNTAAIEASIRAAGADFAKGKAAPLRTGRDIFANATLFAGNDGPAKAWGLYAEGANAAVPGTIDTSDPKSAAMKTGRSKFNVFIRLAGSQVPSKGTLIDRTVAVIGTMTKPPASDYEAVLKVIRAQLKLASRALTDEEIKEILTPAAQNELDKIAAIISAMETYGKMYAVTAKGKFASAYADMVAFSAERVAAISAADNAAADLDA